ncbi:MAG TPA: O-antigen ligase family protein [Thermoleophilaceae bacterium]|nr:O-antigen ligase family protein [Thermoleophilaceae bacterium]
MTYLAAGAGALGAGLLLLSRSRAPLLAGFALLALAEGALLVGGSVGRVLATAVGSPAALATGLVGLAVLAGAAALLVRHPVAVAPLALVAAPLRPPLEFGGGGFPVAIVTSGKLGRLLPLYVVLAAAVVALVWRTLRGERVRALPRRLAVPATAFLALAIVSLLWSADPVAGTSQLAFFWLPFAALLGTLARILVDDPRLPRLLALALVVPALIFAAVGVGQAAAGKIFFSSPDLAAGNAYGSLFRVTSLFDDPSHYGRHLVLAIGVILAALWLGRARLGPGLATIAVLAAGLWFSYSQSSAVSLVAVALAVAFAAGNRRARRLAVAATAVFAVAGAVLLSTQLAGESERQVTSERSRLVEDSARVYLSHPVLGVGLAGQPLASHRESADRGALRRSASHTTPLTVAAELGTLGLLAYIALLVGTVSVLASARRRDPPLALGLAAVLLALFVHSLFYDGFFDNPITWGVLAVGAAVASAAPVGRREQAVSPAPTGAAGPAEPVAR